MVDQLGVPAVSLHFCCIFISTNHATRPAVVNRKEALKSFQINPISPPQTPLEIHFFRPAAGPLGALRIVGHRWAPPPCNLDLNFDSDCRQGGDFI